MEGNVCRSIANGMCEWKNIYDKVLKHFVDEEYARRYGLYWSNIEGGFQKDMQPIYMFLEGGENSASYEWIERLHEIVKCEKVYLLLEEYKQRAKYWIAECNPKIVHLIINDAVEPTDYYITDKKFNWLITENHHVFFYEAIFRFQTAHQYSSRKFLNSLVKLGQKAHFYWRDSSRYRRGYYCQ